MMQFDGKRLQRARKSMGLSLRDLAEKVSLSHATIKKYEDGLLNPSDDVLDAFASILDVGRKYFAPHAEPALSLGQIEFRKQGDLPVKVLESIRNDVLERLERRLELESYFPHAPVPPFSRMDVSGVHSLDDVEDLAERVRKRWNLGGGPVWGLPDILEENGFRVFPVAIGREHGFDGMTASCGELPLVVLSQGFPGDRQRFTLAHELGHQLLQNAKLKKPLTMEQACNHFAGAFLFPKAMVIRTVGPYRKQIDIEELELLKQQYGISIQAILHRCLDLGVITGTTYAELHALFKKNGWDEVEPGAALPVEHGRMLERLEHRAVAEGLLSFQLSQNFACVNHAQCV